MTTKARAFALLFLVGFTACQDPIQPDPPMDLTLTGRVYGDMLGSASGAISGTPVIVSSGNVVERTEVRSDGSFSVVRTQASMSVGVFMEGREYFYPFRLDSMKTGEKRATVSFAAIPRFYTFPSGGFEGETVEIDLERCYSVRGDGDGSAFCHVFDAKYYQNGNLEPVTPLSLPIGIRFGNDFAPTKSELDSFWASIDSINALLPNDEGPWFVPYRPGLLEFTVTERGINSGMPEIKSGYVTSCEVTFATNNFGISSIHFGDIVSHELGHCLGLGHRPLFEAVDDWESVMGKGSWGPADSRYFSRKDVAHLALFREVGMLRKKYGFNGSIYNAYLGIK